MRVPRVARLTGRIKHAAGSRFLSVADITRLAEQQLSVADLRRLLERKLAQEPYFIFQGHRLEYFFHSYNNFRLTERAVEIPIARYYLQQRRYQHVLEIGNVTNHYYDYFRHAFKHKTVIDKYETSYDVINQDIGLYHPEQTFDCALSISTFEHMDSDRGRNPDYVAGSSKLLTLAADNIKHVSELVQEGGTFVLTAALGYAEEWDSTFYSDVLTSCGFSTYRRYVLRKKSEIAWEQVDVHAGQQATYNAPLRGTNYVSVIEFTK